MKSKLLNNSHAIFTIQLIFWCLILGMPLFWGIGSKSEDVDNFLITTFTFNMIALIAIHLLNYMVFIPKYLFQHRRGCFIVANIVLLFAILAISYSINENLFADMLPLDLRRRPRPNMVYIIRDLINYILMIGLVTALRLAERLQQSERALREAESAKIKAELDNLRNQINPHFLLNTLNNIYALTAIDSNKAQETIKELSDLLRYILYENKGDKVSLKSEINFIKSYIKLMSIRLPSRVELSTKFDIPDDFNIDIAPLIFISLIENAFKHSVNGSGDGSIDISFSIDNNNSVTLAIKNSNHAKSDHDKSGHGIGIEQVRRRLDLLYSGRYNWTIEQNREYYNTILTIRERI